MIQVQVDAIQVSLVSQSRVVVLKELNGERYLPIWIGAYEAEAIAIHLQGLQAPRPQTHDLIVNVLQGVDARLRYVYINALVSETFYARLILAVDDLQMEIDTRPSDAIAVAVRMGSRIYVDEEVMELAGIVQAANLMQFDEDTFQVAGEDMDAEDLQVFRDFLNTLNLDDLESDD